MTEQELAAQAAVANQEAEKQNTILRTLEMELEETGEQLTVADYSNLSARIEIAEMRAATAACKAQTLQQEVDTLRSATEAANQREAAERAVAETETRLHQAQAEIASKRQTLQQIQSELPLIQQRASLLMLELSKKRDDRQRLGA